MTFDLYKKEKNNMEKFAVDLDKVLDDFEFNEDCAEQVASIAPYTSHNPPEKLQAPDPPFAHQEPRSTIVPEKLWPNTTDTIDIRKAEVINHDDSVNFSPRYQQSDDKVQEKKSVDFREPDEANSLTIHNDISAKLAQKRQNDNHITKNNNSYDKKLNQPNIKPSVSNVFNSLNEYINASSGSMEAVTPSLDIEKSKMRENNDSRNAQPMTTTMKLLPTYQNILLPMKYESTAEPQEIAEKVEKSTTSVRQVEHVYENVQIPLSALQERNPNSKENSRSSSQDEKHTYENVDFDQESKKGDNPVYDCIYLGKDLPETTTELEIAAKRLTEQFPTNQSSNIKTDRQSTKESEAESTKIVFENVHINPKPVGFSTIDDMSEEELNKYLAELEAEERAEEEAIIYENVSIPGPSTLQKEAARTLPDDEDADEAPIFENVTIGELPTVSEKKLQEKAKKFRVIDYSGTESVNFLDKKNADKFHECVKATTDLKERSVSKTVSISNKSCAGERCLDNSENDDRQRLIAIKTAEESERDDAVEQEREDNSLNNNEEVEDETEDSRSEQKEEAGSAEGGSSRKCGEVRDEIKEMMEERKVEGSTERPPRPQSLDIVNVHEPAKTESSDDVPIFPPTVPSVSATQELDASIIEEPREYQREASPDASDNSSMEFGIVLGKQPPFWVPDSDAPNCMLCDIKFTVIKRRHHCRACGKVLCNKCCSMKYRLEYQGNMDSRVCVPCYQQLVRADSEPGGGDWPDYTNNVDSGINSPQLAGNLPPPPSVMVPVGVLKREGSTKQRAEGQKSVMFSDGIRPGCDLTELDTSWDLKPPYRKSSNKRVSGQGHHTSSTSKRQNLPPLDPHTNSYIPADLNMLPPTVTIHKGQVAYQEGVDPNALYKSLKDEAEPPVMFAINRNLYAYVKITNLNCCVNKICWNVTSRGLACVGQDEVIFLIETLPDETQIPKDLLIHINQIYVEAIKGNTVTELGVSIHQQGNLLGSREHAGFLFIRQTFQCLHKIILPPPPFLVGLLVHRWETPWAKIFPLRLVLRLGAEYRYYPCPLVSVRFRDAVYFEIGHTIMKVLADFRNYAYTLPGVRGMVIHMQDRTTSILFPKNRYDQVIKGLNNSNDHVLAFASNFSVQVDSHLVCIQTNTGDESSYQTQAINIHNKPRKITGASFIVINGALKSSMGLSAKSSIVEDGLMVQIMPEKMEALKAALKNMQDFVIECGRQGIPEPDETVNVKWVENDVHFNLGVKSPIDGKPMDGIPSIRVHNGTDYMGTSRFIRWTEVFIIRSDDHPNGVHDPVDINKLSESIARATCAALVKLLDLLAAAGLTKLAVRTTIHPDNVGYEAGSEGTRLPPIYMNSLDNELIQVLHKAAQSSQDTNTVLELIFHVLDD